MRHRKPLLFAGAAIAASISALAALAALPRPAAADPILAPPGAPGNEPAVDALAAGYQRQQDVFATLENGLSLDPFFLPAEIQGVKDFFAQSASDDFKQVTGKHPYEVLDHFDEHGDEGNFAGIATVGVAARLIALKAAGAPAAEISRARDAAVRAARAWHVYGAIGGPGVVARGVRRVDPWSPGDPPFPGAKPDITPLADAGGSPLPADKGAVWRAPVAPGFDGWIWFDDTSKDQVSGYALAAAWLWDALHDDPEAPADVSEDLAADLAAFAKALMKVAPELEIDLCIRDADGRLTNFHDLNPRQLSPDGVLPEESTLRNGFNAALALAIVRAAYHVSGDPEIGKYYYETLVGARDLPKDAATTTGIIFLGAATNYSNVNMMAIALATLGRFETDPYVRSRIEETLSTQFWDVGSDRDVSHVKQAWFDAIYGAYALKPPAEIRDRVIENLSGFQAAPAFDRDRINCDDAEIAAGMCTGVDGSTAIVLLPKPGHNGQPVAKDIVPMAIRPDSDFAWRSDPHTVNGSASTRMNPGGDFLAAYWLARASELGDRDKNLSPYARPALPYTLGGEPATPPPAATDATDTGCGACETKGRPNEGTLPAIAIGLAISAAAVSRRRRAQRR